MKAHPSVQPLYKCCAHVGIPRGADFCFRLSEIAEPRALGLKLLTVEGGSAEGRAASKTALSATLEGGDRGVALGLFFLLVFFNWLAGHAFRLMWKLRMLVPSAGRSVTFQNDSEV